MIKIFGLRRSGTNYVASLLRQNFQDDILIHAGCSKHGKPHNLTKLEIKNWIKQHKNEWFGLEHFKDIAQLNRALSKEIKNVYVVKELFAWLYSYRRYSNLNSHHPTEPPLKLFSFGDKNTLKILIEKYYEFLHAAMPTCFVIPYELLLQDINVVLNDLKNWAGLKPKYPDFQNNLNYIDCGFNQTEIPFNKENKEFYINREYLKEFSEEQIDFINSILL